MADQGTYTATNLPKDGDTIEASDVNTDLQGLIDEFNKSIGTAKLSDSGVTGSKLATNAILLGNTQLTTNFSSSVTPTITDITNFTVTVIVPSGGRSIEIEVFAAYQNSTAAASDMTLYIFEGSTTLAKSLTSQTAATQSGLPAFVKYIGTPTDGTHTYKVSFSQSTAGTYSLVAAATYPAYISVKLI